MNEWYMRVVGGLSLSSTQASISFMVHGNWALKEALSGVRRVWYLDYVVSQ